ncbi:MAG: UDP-N-acetylmuramoyl-L-alanine--D-glutamate ligase [Patescibacteria group bacterium]|jgi:UDP-N-acetylmuramoylalanine--D-glutamate ligase
MTDVHHKRVLVMGLGLHGGAVAVVRWLVEQGALVTVTDLRDRKTLAPSIRELKKLSVTYVLGKHRNQDIDSAELIVKNPAVPPESSYLRRAHAKRIPVVSDIQLFFERCPARIIGITGTKGKSTTSALVYEMLKKRWPTTALAGNSVGSPLSLLRSLHQHDRVVLELSSWQLEDVARAKMSPHVSLVTNISADHLNRHGSMSAYVQAKRNILNFQTASDTAALNYDDVRVRALAKFVRGNILWFSSNPQKISPVYYPSEGWVMRRRYASVAKTASTTDRKIAGRHNLVNIVAATAIADFEGVPHRTITAVIAAFKGIAGRMELLGVKKGVRYINDTTATAPAAAIAALEAIHGRILLIAGGSDKNLPLEGLAQAIARRTDAVFLLPGTATKKLSLLLSRQGVHAELVATMTSAVRRAARHAKAGDTVLLSPGVASFGLFLHEFDRGDAFKKIFRTLPA